MHGKQDAPPRSAPHDAQPQLVGNALRVCRVPLQHNFGLHALPRLAWTVLQLKGYALAGARVGNGDGGLRWGVRRAIQGERVELAGVCQGQGRLPGAPMRAQHTQAVRQQAPCGCTRGQQAQRVRHAAGAHMAADLWLRAQQSTEH